MRWVCVRTQLRVCRGISVKLLLVLRVKFVFPPLGNWHYARLSTCLCFPQPALYWQCYLAVFVSNSTLSVENKFEPVRQGHVLWLDTYWRIRWYRGEGWFREKRAAGRFKEGVPCAGVEEWAGIELSLSAARHWEMQGVLIPAVKVSTDAERKKFHDMWHSHLVPGGRSLLDFPAFTLE